MKVTSVTYGRTWNTGKFESAKLEVTADVEHEKGETGKSVLEELQKIVESRRPKQTNTVADLNKRLSE